MRLVLFVLLIFPFFSYSYSINDYQDSKNSEWSTSHHGSLLDHFQSNDVILKSKVKIEVSQNYCCRICTTGKACGNSCISRYKNCTKAPGCACDSR